MALIKISVLTDDRALGGRVVKLPTFVSLGISNKGALLIVRGQCIALVLLYMHIGRAAPYP